MEISEANEYCWKTGKRYAIVKYAITKKSVPAAMQTMNNYC